MPEANQVVALGPRPNLKDVKKKLKNTTSQIKKKKIRRPILYFQVYSTLEWSFVSFLNV
jgi:hypothetical protein